MAIYPGRQRRPHLVHASTGKVLIAYGDLKAFAMAGAWFGLGALPFLFTAFVLAIALFTILMAVRGRSGPLPTGPAHLIASVAYAVGTKLI